MKYYLKKYKRSSGFQPVDVYSMMNDYINRLWNYLGATYEYIELLKKLSKYKIDDIASIAKNVLVIALENQNKSKSLSLYYR